MYRTLIRIIGCIGMIVAWVVALKSGQMDIAESIQMVGIVIAAAILMR